MAQREAQSPDPVYEAVCFHAQQCAEKYIKAFLEEQNLHFPKTHDLILLLHLGQGQLPALDALRQALARLSAYAVAFRYPGTQADSLAAQDALTIAERVRQAVRAEFGMA